MVGCVVAKTRVTFYFLGLWGVRAVFVELLRTFNRYVYYIHMATTVFTSTISPGLNRWIDAQAKREKCTRREVLEEAIVAFKRAKMREGFLRAAKDKDIVEMAEWGMDEYSHMLERV